MKKNLIKTIIIITVSIFLSSCSRTLYERKKDDKNPADQGVETQVKLQGPRAVMETTF
jgi:uncharacterized alpha/beta hydrolase family protein